MGFDPGWLRAAEDRGMACVIFADADDHRFGFAVLANDPDRGGPAARHLHLRHRAELPSFGV